MMMASKRAGRSAVSTVLLLLYGCRGAEPPAVPLPDLTAAEPQAATAVEEARQAVVDALGEAGAWGELGMVLHAHGFHEDALTSYRQAAELGPAEVRWAYFPGRILLDQDPAEARAHLERARDLAPRSLPIRLALADALIRLGEAAAAADLYRRVLESDPESLPALLQLGALELADGSPETARQLLELAAEAAPWDRRVHTSLARWHRRAGNAERADREALLARAFPETTPVPDPLLEEMRGRAVSSRAHTERGLAHVGRGEVEAAERQFRRVLEIRPGNAEDHMNLGGALAAQGRFPEAIEHYQTALSLAAESSEAHRNLAVVLLAADRVEEAIGQLRQALAADPRAAAAHFQLGVALARQGELAEAAASYRTALELNPVHPGAHNNLANLLIQQGRRAEAESHWRQAVDFGREPTDALFNLAVLSAREGAFGEAVTLLERAAAAVPERPDVLAALTTLRATCPEAAHRDGQQAVRLARRLLAIHGPRHVPSLGLLAAALAEAGDFPAALEASGEALGLARATGPPRFAALLESQMALYRQGRPYHQSAP